MHEGSLFSKNSNLYGNNEESMLGSLGFNYNFNRKEDPLISFFDSNFPDFKKTDKFKDSILSHFKADDGHVSEREERSEDNLSRKVNELEEKKENNGEKSNGVVNRDEPDKKLGNLMSLLDQIEKEKDLGSEEEIGNLQNNNNQEESNHSNRFKDIKTVSIVKKKPNS